MRNILHVLAYFAIGTLALIASGTSAGGNWRDQVAKQQRIIFQQISCPREIDAKADALVRKRDSLPKHLRGTGKMTMTMDTKALLKILPPEVRSKTSDELLKALQSGMPDRDEMYKRKPPGFMSKTYASISLQNKTPQYCNENCQADFTRETVAAIALWKNACLLCSGDHLAFIKTPTGIMIDSRIAEWLSSAKVPLSATFPLSSDNASFIQRSLDRVSSGLGMSAPQSAQDKAKDLVTYIDFPSELKSRLCSVSYPRQEAARALRALSDVVCKTSSSSLSEDGVDISILLLPNQTSCGPASEFYACGRPDNSIEITFRGAEYEFLDPSTGISRTYGQEGGDHFSGLATITHEVGHWFGLPHIQDDRNPDPRLSTKEIPDIMQSSIDKTSCVSQLSLWLINNMSAQEHQNRFRAGGGLRRR